MYDSITTALLNASNSAFPKVRCSSSKTNVPGWNEYVKEAHSEARESFLLWQSAGKPHAGPVCHDMKITRARFKRCLRFCKSIEQKAKADAIAKKFMLKDSIEFWKDIKYLGSTGSNIEASTIDGFTGDINICKMWQQHYDGILNSNNDTSHKSYVINGLSQIVDSDSVNLMFTDINEAIKDMKSGKSAGIDGLQSEHVKHADASLSCLLSMLFNSIFNHGYLPKNIIHSIIVPIIKDKKGIVTNKDNYRPIAITSVLSKLIEIIMLDNLHLYLHTHSNQFGFKKKLGTDLCIFTLKQIIEFYRDKGSPMYVCFLDASKAFDRVNHWCLFKKLISRGVPFIYIRLLVYWYSNQTFNVRWGNTMSQSFTASNGVRQGGIMSPILFNTYMDDLSTTLNNSGYGCYFNGTLYNHLMYADDTCIIAPSPKGLYELLSLCNEFAITNNINFNASKSKYMCFSAKSFSNLHIPNMYINDVLIPLVDHTKYLGVVITNSLRDDSDILRHVKAIYSRGNLLVSKFKYCSEDVKKCLFNTYLRTIYCGQLWTDYKKCTFKKSIVAYNNVYRKFFNIKLGDSISQIFVHDNVDHFNIIVRKTLSSFRSRILSCDNNLVSTIVNSMYFMFHSNYSYQCVNQLFCL